MIARIDIHRTDEHYGYRVLADADVLYDDTGLTSVVACLVSAVEGLPPQVRAWRWPAAVSSRARIR